MSPPTVDPGMSDVADREWRLIRDEPRDGPTQMALEEVAGRTAVERGVRTVRTYSWEPGTVSLGYRNEASAIDREFCEREGIGLTRRQTGGGAIYHDARGDISYTIVAPSEEVPGDLMACYELFCEPILEGLRRMGVDADFAARERPAIHEPSCYLRGIDPAHDVVAPAGEADARKISGNAQYRRNDVVIQHGSISYELVPERHLGVFADADASVGQFRERVTGVREVSSIDREAAVALLGDALGEWCNATEGSWRTDELEAARELADRKYGAEAWIRDRERHEPPTSR